MTSREKIRFLIVRTIGNFLVLFAIFGVFATFGPALYYEATYQVMRIRGVSFAVDTQVSKQQAPKAQKITRQTTVSFGDILSGPKEQILTPIDTVFDILIPKIGANARIFPNVDPSDPNIFLPILQKGVRMLRVRFFPDNREIFIFSPTQPTIFGMSADTMRYFIY